MRIFTASILYFGRHTLLICDGKCSHAWGRRRPKQQLSDDEDDVLFASDDEAGPCPLSGLELDADGGDCKPDNPDGMNRWCARSCERSCMIDISTGRKAAVTLPDWSTPVYNMPRGTMLDGG